MMCFVASCHMLIRVYCPASKSNDAQSASKYDLLSHITRSCLCVSNQWAFAFSQVQWLIFFKSTLKLLLELGSELRSLLRTKHSTGRNPYQDQYQFLFRKVSQALIRTIVLVSYVTSCQQHLILMGHFCCRCQIIVRSTKLIHWQWKREWVKEACYSRVSLGISLQMKAFPIIAVIEICFMGLAAHQDAQKSQKLLYNVSLRDCIKINGTIALVVSYRLENIIFFSIFNS